MVKVCQTGLLKLNLKLYQKKHFPVFAMDEVEIFFGQFPNPWVLRVSRMGCYLLDLKMWKKSTSLHPTAQYWPR